MKNILVTLGLIFGMSVSGYTQSYGEFIQLKDGSILKGSVEISEKLFRSSKIILNDTTTFLLKNVEAYQDDGDYFKRIALGFSSGDQFARRTEKGNIDLFERYEDSFTPGYFVPGPNGTSMFMGGGSSGSNKQYFSKNDGPVMVANAHNLKKELSDNALSMEYLRKRDGLTTIQVLGTITGVVIGAVSVSNQAGKDSLDPTGLVIGAAMITGTVWIPFSAKQELTRKSIEAYNHPERF